jgi:hypothetical protein
MNGETTILDSAHPRTGKFRVSAHEVFLLHFQNTTVLP